MALFDFSLSPEATTAPLDQAIGKIAAEFGVSPNAIKQVIQVESGGDPRASTGSYNGLTQIGPATFNEAGGTLGGMTYDQYKQATPEQQVGAYGDYLRHYKFADQMQQNGIDLSKLNPDQQFAILQGMQFSPNGQGWKGAAGRGNFNVPVTNTQQAGALGDISLAAMAGSRYGQAALGGAPIRIANSPASQPMGYTPPFQPQQPLPPQPLNLAQGQMPAFPFSPQAAPQQDAPLAPTMGGMQMQAPQIQYFRPDAAKLAQLRSYFSRG